MERMLARPSGIMGFPLRLLARENYDRAVAAKGAHAVALITGEEKIVPRTARYFMCTIEAMPADTDVAFVGIDEVQLAADPDRGHVFTDRILNTRGTEETLLIGAETVRPIIHHLVPNAEFVSRPRFSRLSYAGARQVTRLPPRTAIIGFSATDVYTLAELMRRRRGGAAVVLGALSPRTRNAQVAMYQAGDVDYLVATDAIGMGLNMDVDHVAFARLSKFDGRTRRRLSAAEIGQIAGRAGRHMTDGTFGTTAGEPGLDADIVSSIEDHDFPALRQVMWRNSALDFASVDGLLASLSQPARDPMLVAARTADDVMALQDVVRDDRVRQAADRPARVALLWDVCQIPDFRKLSGDSHARMIGRIFRDLTGSGRIDADWMARHVTRLDTTKGDIGALVGRIADIRTWTYVSQRLDWLDDSRHWQDRTRQIEDSLSDALHDRLTERFVDKRTAALFRRLRAKDRLTASVAADGAVLVEGLPVGRLNGFRFALDDSVFGDDAKAVRQAAARALGDAYDQRVTALQEALAVTGDKLLRLGDGGTILWQDAVIARLAKGTTPVQPQIVIDSAEQMPVGVRDRLMRLVQDWLARFLDARLGCLRKTLDRDCANSVRGIIFQLAEQLGCRARRDLEPLLGALDGPDRKYLAQAGIRLGTETIYMPALLTPKMLHIRGLLWQCWRGEAIPGINRRRAIMPVAGIPGFEKTIPDATCLALGYPRCGAYLVRADHLELLALEIRKQARHGAFSASDKLRQLTGLADDDMRALLRGLGLHSRMQGDSVLFYRPKRRTAVSRPPAQALQAGSEGKQGKPNRPAKKRKSRDRGPNPCSPFAILHELTGRKPS